MGTVLTVAGSLALGIVGLALLLLCVPWVVLIVAATTPSRKLNVELRPFARGFPARLRFDALSGERFGGEKSPMDVTKPDEPSATKATSGLGLRDCRGVSRMLHAAPRLLKGLLSVFRIERLHVKGTAGLADPADTGQLFGAILPLTYILPTRRFSIDLQPDFNGPSLDCEVDASIRVHPIRIIPPALRFGWQVFVRPT